MHLRGFSDAPLEPRRKVGPARRPASTRPRAPPSLAAPGGRWAPARKAQPPRPAVLQAAALDAPAPRRSSPGRPRTARQARRQQQDALFAKLTDASQCASSPSEPTPAAGLTRGTARRYTGAHRMRFAERGQRREQTSEDTYDLSKLVRSPAGRLASG